MKEAVYGYSDGEKNITYDNGRINYVSETSTIGTAEVRTCYSDLSEVPSASEGYDDFER
jgi:hypothetical protein